MSLRSHFISQSIVKVLLYLVCSSRNRIPLQTQSDHTVPTIPKIHPNIVASGVTEAERPSSPDEICLGPCTQGESSPVTQSSTLEGTTKAKGEELPPVRSIF